MRRYFPYLGWQNLPRELYIVIPKAQSVHFWLGTED